MVVRNFMADKSNPTNSPMHGCFSREGFDGYYLFPYLLCLKPWRQSIRGFYGLANAHNFAHVVQALYEGICFSQQAHLSE